MLNINDFILDIKILFYQLDFFKDIYLHKIINKEKELINNLNYNQEIIENEINEILNIIKFNFLINENKKIIVKIEKKFEENLNEIKDNFAFLDRKFLVKYNLENNFDLLLYNNFLLKEYKLYNIDINKIENIFDSKEIKEIKKGVNLNNEYKNKINNFDYKNIYLTWYFKRYSLNQDININLFKLLNEEEINKINEEIDIFNILNDIDNFKNKIQNKEQIKKIEINENDNKKNNSLLEIINNFEIFGS